jgi:signal transduction histidine kinase
MVTGTRTDPDMATTAADAMGTDTEIRDPPSLATLLVVAVAGAAAAGILVFLAFGSDHLDDPAVRAILGIWITIPYIAAGLLAWWRRPDSRFGLLMIVAGFGTLLSVFTWANSIVLYTVGQAFDFLPPVLLIHLILAFPSGRLERTLERSVVVAAYVLGVGFALVRLMLGGVDPPTLLEVVSNPEAALVVERVILLGLSVLCLAGVGVLAVRRRDRGRPLRRWVAVLVDSFALVLVMIALLFVAGTFGWPAFEAIRRVTFLVIGLAPVAFLIGLLQARLARSSVGDLMVELQKGPTPGDVGDALARALRDPSLTLAFWLPEFGRYVDLDGRPVETSAQNGRASTPIDLDGTHVAMLLHDAALHDEPELLAAVTAAAGMALDNARLQAELRARVDELRGSRARILEAGQQERQRLERNLHDGAQQRLIALSLELGLLEANSDVDSEARARLDRAREEIAASLEELRDVSRGLHPAVVSGHGLAVALESLAARAPVPVRLSVAVEGRMPEAIEIAAYYVVSESLTNVAKHANASSATVEVRRAGGQAVIVVTDDGIGGADTELGSGLRGLADRVEALDGVLRVWSPPGGGTRLRAEIPCE